MIDVIIPVWLAACAVTFTLFGIDKHRARLNRWRIRERTLWIFCIALGAPGGWAGMLFFHHKTKKTAFRFGVPALAAVQAAGLFAWIYYYLTPT